jgi:hypothetical protein
MKKEAQAKFRVTFVNGNHGYEIKYATTARGAVRCARSLWLRPSEDPVPTSAVIEARAVDHEPWWEVVAEVTPDNIIVEDSSCLPSVKRLDDQIDVLRRQRNAAHATFQALNQEADRLYKLQITKGN